MWTNWESLPEKDEECYINTEFTPCKQGRIPLYAVIAETIEEVQATVRFAGDRNLRLIIRNTGHDSSGKSSGPDSLQLNLSRFKQITHSSNFLPCTSRCEHYNTCNCSRRTESLGQAVTLGAGVLTHELAESAVKAGVVVLLGSCPTVGVAGGFLQGGGISNLAPMFGTPADNALEFLVVTAQGDIVVANDFQNQDLFWALRGGGGGTFGIAVSSTVRTYPDIPVVRIQLDITIPERQPPTTTDHDTGIWAAVAEVIDTFPSLDTGHNTMSVLIIPTPRLTTTPASIKIVALVTNATTTHANDLYAPLLYNLATRNITHNYTSALCPRLSAEVPTLGFSTPAGTGCIEGSIFISADFLQDNHNRRKLTHMLAISPHHPDDIIELMLQGGQIRENARFTHTAIHPTWRSALASLVIHRRMSASPSAEEIEFYRTEMTEVQMPLMRSLEGKGVMGSYLNTADPDEPRIKQAFWGEENYASLLRVKSRWDPKNLFIVRSGVGSEEWDGEKMCRLS